MLGFKNFCNEIRDRLPEYLMQYDIEDIRINPVKKNNELELTAVVVSLKGENISPSIYIDRYYPLYMEGMPFENIMNEIRSDYIKARDNIPMLDLSNIYSREKLFVRVVNYDKNRELLENIPHERYLDMAVTARLLVRNDSYGIASAIVDNNVMERLNMTKDELFAAAKENSAVIFPPTINTLQSIIERLSGEYNDFPAPQQIYVMTNTAGNSGASCLVYDGALKYAAEKVGGSFMVLPSSIHEVLLVPSEGASPEELQEIVAYVNATTVSETEYLSDSVYEYDREKDILSIAAEGKDNVREDEMER